jgi:hypothetical protein
VHPSERFLRKLEAVGCPLVQTHSLKCAATTAGAARKAGVRPANGPR